MATEGGEDPFNRFFDVDVLARLENTDWFIDCIAHVYQRIARSWNCDVIMSDRRLLEACDFWEEDVRRTKEFGIDHDPPMSGGPEDAAISVELDHFKHASILAFWLRRLIPINEVWPILKDGTFIDAKDYIASPIQKHFLEYGNEICALVVGFFIAANYELQALEQRLQEEHGGLPENFDRLALIGKIRLPQRFILEFPKLLKHKNMSSHAIYMLYRSMFDRPPEAWPEPLEGARVG